MGSVVIFGLVKMGCRAPGPATTMGMSPDGGEGIVEDINVDGDARSACGEHEPGAFIAGSIQANRRVVLHRAGGFCLRGPPLRLRFLDRVH